METVRRSEAVPQHPVGFEVSDLAASENRDEEAEPTGLWADYSS